ncbi:hypothetical protein G3N96_21310 [Burkholderia sp. Se-20373]|nr:hypothetical protein [Burkholderia sp. Se-20373]
MKHELIVPCWTRGRIWPTFAYFTAVSASSLRLYRGTHAAGLWIVALYSALIAVPVCRLLFTKRFVFSDQPKSIRYESRFAGIVLKSNAMDPNAFKWVRSRMGSFEPRDAIVELGMEHSYDAVTVQTIKYAMNETPEVIKTRSEIAGILAIVDRGHEHLPPQRITS